MPTKPDGPGASKVNLPKSKGWRKVCGPVTASSNYDKGTGHFTNYRLDQAWYCGLGNQALGRGKATKEEALAGSTSTVGGYVVAVERWIINDPNLSRWQILEVWIKD